MAQHRLQLSIYCSVQENQRQALHFTLQVRRLGLCTCQNMVDQGQRLTLPSWEQHRQEADSGGPLCRRCFAAARLPQRQRKGETNLGLIDGTWLASVVMDRAGYMDESQREMERDDCRAIRFLSKHTIITFVCPLCPLCPRSRPNCHSSLCGQTPGEWGRCLVQHRRISHHASSHAQTDKAPPVHSQPPFLFSTVIHRCKPCYLELQPAVYKRFRLSC